MLLAYRLAREVGIAAVEDEGGLLDQITYWQAMRWAEYGETEPWGQSRDDLRAGIIASTIANTVRPRNQKPFKPGDFMPEFRRKAQSPDEMKQLFKAYARQVKAVEASRERH